MRLLKQVGKDVINEIAWILFFAIIASVSLYGVSLYSGGTIGLMISTKNSAEKIKQSDAYFVKLLSTTYNDEDEPAPKISDEKAEENEKLITSFIKNNCSPEKRMIGAVYDVGDSWGGETYPYKDVYVLIGAYAYMSNFEGVSEDYPAIAVTSDIKEKVGKEKYNGCEITDVLPNDFGIYSGLFGISIIEPQKNTLIVFATDYDQLQMVMPGLPIQRYIESMIFVNSTEEERAEFSNIIYRVARGYVSYSTLEEETRLDSDYRDMWTTIIVYFVAVVAIIGSMLYNTIRTVRRKTAEYTIQHLYGANCLFLYARIFLFILAYYSLALILFCIINIFSYPVPTVTIIAVIGLIVLMAAAVALEELLYFKKQFSKGLIRRENS